MGGIGFGREWSRVRGCNEPQEDGRVGKIGDSNARDRGVWGDKIVIRISVFEKSGSRRVDVG